MLADTMKIPDPIIDPATSIVASVRVIALTNPDARTAALRRSRRPSCSCRCAEKARKGVAGECRRRLRWESAQNVGSVCGSIARRDAGRVSPRLRSAGGPLELVADLRLHAQRRAVGPRARPEAHRAQHARRCACCSRRRASRVNSKSSTRPVESTSNSAMKRESAHARRRGQRRQEELDRAAADSSPGCRRRCPGPFALPFPCPTPDPTPPPLRAAPRAVGAAAATGAGHRRRDRRRRRRRGALLRRLRRLAAVRPPASALAARPWASAPAGGATGGTRVGVGTGSGSELHEAQRLRPCRRRAAASAATAARGPARPRPAASASITERGMKNGTMSRTMISACTHDETTAPMRRPSSPRAAGRSGTR